MTQKLSRNSEKRTLGAHRSDSAAAETERLESSNSVDPTRGALYREACEHLAGAVGFRLSQLWKVWPLRLVLVVKRVSLASLMFNVGLICVRFLAPVEISRRNLKHSPRRVSGFVAVVHSQLVDRNRQQIRHSRQMTSRAPRATTRCESFEDDNHLHS